MSTTQKQKLVDEINDVLERGDGSLTSAVRKAARLALLCDDHEHRMLFDMHLNGVNPKNLENIQIPKWPDKNLLPKWDVITAFRHDRVLEGESIMPLPLEDFESRYRMLMDEINKERIRENYQAHQIVYENYEKFVTIYSRIRTRVGSFVRSVEVTLSENQSGLGEPRSRMRATDTSSVFIGHGHSNVWKDLRDLLTERLRLSYEEFNRESVAGKTTKERLTEMLDRATFAFLVMTAEDEHGDSKLHARENVIHEVGLFQGRLGFEKGIVLLEEGCVEFSNITGLTQIRFPKGNIIAAAEEIRRVLERERLL